MTNSMSFGRPYILKTNGCIHDGWLVIGNIDTVFNQDYLYYALSSSFMYTTLNLLAAGSTVKNLKSDTVRSVLFPIPPFGEQERMARRLEQLIILVDAINAEKGQLVDIINQTKSKILDLAIRGKLVPQDPNDEPASVLLERIRSEKEELIKQGKIKRDKKESVIFRGDDNSYYEKVGGRTENISDKLPFDLPDGWCWARLKHICMMASGKSKPSEQIKDKPFEGCYPCFGGNGIRGFVDEYNQDGTFSIVGRQGALCGNINIASGKFYATEHAVITTIFSEIDFGWSNYTLDALKLNEYATGAAQPGLSVANVLNVFVPVPPKHEQKHIASTISSAFSFLAVIEKSLS